MTIHCVFLPFMVGPLSFWDSEEKALKEIERLESKRNEEGHEFLGNFEIELSYAELNEALIPNERF